jgi:hypothetical protein
LKKEPEKEPKAESKEVLREESKEGVNEVLEKETVLINLKTYLRREEGLIETKEEEYILSEIAKQYVISLCRGAEIYRTWEIDCIDEGSPYIIFNEKGIRIPNDKCPDKPVWFLLKSGFEFESGIPIIEERIGLNITGDYRLLFVDLTGITQFALKIKGKIEEDEKYIKEHDSMKYTNMEYTSMINTGLWEPYLNGGHILPQVKILESPVYTQKPEKIIVPIDKEIGITGWTFMIRQGIGKSCSRRYYRIQDLKGIEAFHDKGYVEIPLNTAQLSGENPIGWYTFCLRSPKRKEIYLNCAVIPGLKIVFKPQLHFPSNQVEEPCEEASLSIISPEGTSFILEQPSRILAAQERVYDIRIPWNADVAKGVVSVLASNKTNDLDKVDDLSKLDKAVDLNKADVDDMNIMGDLDKVDILNEIDKLDKIDEDKENLPIKIELPNVKWRIYGLKSNFMKGDFNDEAKDDGVKDSILKNNSYEDWNIYEKEIWIGDWEQYEKVQIHIKVPIESAYCYRFYLEDLKDGLEHYIDGKLIDGKSVIELLEFTDTIRRNPGLSRFCMEVYDQRLSPIGKGRIFTLHSKWEVEDIICQVSGFEDKIYLYCQWKDLGKAENRVLRLWKCWKPWEKPLTYNIPDGKNTIEIKEAKSKLIPGKYIIQFDIEDPWLSNDNHLFPKEEFSNIQYLDIQDKEPYIHTELKVTWPNEKKAIIEGKTVGIQNGQQISAFLLGIHRGQAIVCQGISTILLYGDFSIHIDQTQYYRQTQYLSQNQYLEQTKYTEQIKHFNNTVPNLKKFAHWVILKVDNTILSHPPIYTAVILQQPNILEYQLNWVRKKQLSMQKYIKQVDIIDKKGLVIYKLLNVKQLYRIINAWVKGEREVVLTAKVKGRDQGIQVSFDHNTGKCYIGIQKGIRCTSCGAFLPNQEVWHREHYPKCKSFIFRYTKLLEISILLMLDFESYILRFKKLYPLAGYEPLELYSNKHDQLPDYLWMGKNKFSHDNRDKYENIVNLLVDKEVELLNKAEKSIQSSST